MRGRKNTLLWLLASLLLAGCSPEKPSAPDSRTGEALSPSTVPQSREPAKLARLWTTTARQACESGQNLAKTVESLIQQPSPERLSAAREAWRTAHRHYRRWSLLQAIAAPSRPFPARDVFDRIDAHPLLPGYLDQVPGYPVSGLVHSEVPLTPEALRDRHQSTDVLYGVTGFHPLAFMLWGSPDDAGKPSRQADDFRPAPNPGGLPVRARRASLTETMATLLARDLEPLCTPNTNSTGLRRLSARLATARDQAHLREQWLERELLPTLQAWAASEEETDRSGTPLWHAQFARTDFREWHDLLEWTGSNVWPEAPVQENLDGLGTLLTELDRAGPDGRQRERLGTQLALMAKQNSDNP